MEDLILAAVMTYSMIPPAAKTRILLKFSEKCPLPLKRDDKEIP